MEKQIPVNEEATKHFQGTNEQLPERVLLEHIPGATLKSQPQEQNLLIVFCSFSSSFFLSLSLSLSFFGVSIVVAWIVIHYFQVIL